MNWVKQILNNTVDTKLSFLKPPCTTTHLFSHLSIHLARVASSGFGNGVIGDARNKMQALYLFLFCSWKFVLSFFFFVQSLKGNTKDHKKNYVG